MNDPHVTALVYRLKHPANVNYDKAVPLEYETADFRVTIKNLQARFEMKGHFATPEEARKIVETVIREWEFAVNLNEGLGEFEFVFSNAEIEDRNPTPGVVSVQAASMVMVGGTASIIVGRGKYPEPPKGIAINADVEVMALRLSRYREKKDTLAGMAYFCLTVLEQAAGGRDAIPTMFGVTASVVKTLGRLTGEKGGSEARKGMGRSHEFSWAERSWIEEAIKRLIWRAAEVACNPASAGTPITMADLPKL
jgi:hypothetical protein